MSAIFTKYEQIHASKEFNRFFKQHQHLRKILEDARAIFKDISHNGFFEEYFDEVDGRTLPEILEEENGCADKIIKTPCLVIYGQEFKGQAEVLNNICQNQLIDVDTINTHAIQRNVKITYGKKQTFSISVAGSANEDYDLIDCFTANQNDNNIITAKDLEIPEEDMYSEELCSSVLEVKTPNDILKDGCVIFVLTNNNKKAPLTKMLKNITLEYFPIFIYAINNLQISKNNIDDLMYIKDSSPDITVLFVDLINSFDLTESQDLITSNIVKHQLEELQLIPSDLEEGNSLTESTTKNKRIESFVENGFFNESTMEEAIPEKHREKMVTSDKRMLRNLMESKIQPYHNIYTKNHYIGSKDFNEQFSLFTKEVLKARIIQLSSHLNAILTECLEECIASAFQFARQMQVTPARLDWAKKKELELYDSLVKISSIKQEEIRDLISDTIVQVRHELLTEAAAFQLRHVTITETGNPTNRNELRNCQNQIENLVLEKLNNKIADKLVASVNYLRQTFIETLRRTLKNLEDAENPEGALSSAELALTKILGSAYSVKVSPKTTSTLRRALVDRMRQMLTSMSFRNTPKIDDDWKRKIASEMINKLSEEKLARSICQQFRSNLDESHQHFQNCIKQIEQKLNARLEKTEEKGKQVRKYHAPRIARQVLESISLRDAALYGMPAYGGEIGRGQYGVVYSCNKWGNHSPCAVKSVAPPDDKHWNNLAMEFYYTKTLPEHDRIVQIRGSVIDYTYGNGSGAVLLVMDRVKRDLHSAIKSGLGIVGRLQVGVDVVEGLRFLHKEGLVHRDVKLKNVLLDEVNRAKITDLGFCKPEAMMSGSIVGTPIHMAPELFKGHYDNNVDTYAFGILFWYICAGTIRLPQNYEQCASKEQLWSAVQKGVRPEKLPAFDDECWNLMNKCWAYKPINRPHLGEVEPKLFEILHRYKLMQVEEESKARRLTKRSERIT